MSGFKVGDRVRVVAWPVGLNEIGIVEKALTDRPPMPDAYIVVFSDGSLNKYLDEDLALVTAAQPAPMVDAGAASDASELTELGYELGRYGATTEDKARAVSAFVQKHTEVLTAQITALQNQLAAANKPVHIPPVMVGSPEDEALLTGAASANTGLDATTLENWPRMFRERATDPMFAGLYNEAGKNDILDLLDVVATLQAELAAANQENARLRAALDAAEEINRSRALLLQLFGEVDFKERINNRADNEEIWELYNRCMGA